MSESGDINEFKQIRTGGKLGRLQNSGKTDRYGEMGKVGPTQSQKSDTPHTKDIHRSGVSAEAITSSELTKEQAM